MWEPFTDSVRSSIVRAHEEARRLGDSYVDTEHLLLGIISEGENDAVRVMKSLDIDPEKIRSEVESKLGKAGKSPKVDTQFSPRGKRVIENSYEESRALKHNFTDTEHLMLALLRERKGVAHEVLTGLAPAEEIRDKLIKSLEKKKLPMSCKNIFARFSKWKNKFKVKHSSPDTRNPG